MSFVTMIFDVDATDPIIEILEIAELSTYPARPPANGALTLMYPREI